MIGLAGKLPAHGDFVRRGGPAPVLAALDRWLDAELSRAPDLAQQLDALDGWRLAVRFDEEAVLGVIIASEDRVGRSFPLIATLTLPDPPAPDDAEQWCLAASAALQAARDGGVDGDGLAVALDALPRPAACADGAAGWWRAGEETPVGEAALPKDQEFASLFEETVP